MFGVNGRYWSLAEGPLRGLRARITALNQDPWFEKGFGVTLKVYGIPNCDTVKKSRVWLDQQGIPYEFHDYKKQGVDEGALRSWIKDAGWEKLLNRAGTTFRKLPEEERADLNEDKAVAIMLANPSTIKRPVVTGAGSLLVGFKPDDWARAF